MIVPITLCFHSVAIATAAMEMLGGEAAMNSSRKPDIMADAAYLILTRASRDVTGKFLIDDDVLKEHGITDLDQYANTPGRSRIVYKIILLVGYSPGRIALHVPSK